MRVCRYAPSAGLRPDPLSILGDAVVTAGIRLTTGLYRAACASLDAVAILC